jgi:photosystem II stability/assembly factor-like uncharacterized protein
MTTKVSARRASKAAACALAAGWLTCASASADERVWTPLGGPTGGDVRALAADPREPRTVFLGTGDGVLYRSDDGGRRWRRLVPGFPRPGMSLDDIVVDRRGRVLVGFWQVSGSGGGVARSTDGGRTFTLLPLEGASVRALAVAPSNPDVLVAGTLTGVFRSDDGGDAWRRISPAEHPELRNVNSVAVDPADPDVIYAGTWHLPWKTRDGGRTWRQVAAGMISDSDVMTLNIDRRDASGVYASACSGIYRSNDGAARWTKVPGIPASSRRTRAFTQDPERPDTFYAGTTAGLWRSQDGLRTWTLVSEKDLVVNALAVLPGGVLLAGTDAAGVRRSDDRGATWTASNDGFAERFVSEILFDRGGRVVVGLLGDRFHSGVMQAPSLHGPWSRLGAGLEGREVLSLALLPGAQDTPAQVLAGTDDGVFLAPASGAWRRLPTEIDGLDERPRVAAVAVAAMGSRAVLLATAQGVLRSTDRGRSWTRTHLGLARAVTALASSQRDTSLVLAATPLEIFRSRDAGATWERAGPAPAQSPLHKLALLPGRDEVVVGASARGLWLSSDQGRSWAPRGGGLPRGHISGLALDADGRTLVASNFDHGGLYESRDGGVSWNALSTAGLASERVWALAVDPAVPGRIVAAPPTGGLHALGQTGSSSTAAGGAGSP